MLKKEQIEKIDKTFELFNKAVVLMLLTTRLMKAFVRQVEKDTARRRKEGGEKK